jgi:hypothetical protein
MFAFGCRWDAEHHDVGFLKRCEEKLADGAVVHRAGFAAHGDGRTLLVVVERLDGERRGENPKESRGNQQTFYVSSSSLHLEWSSEQRTERFLHFAYGHQLDVPLGGLETLHVEFGNEDSLESQFFGLRHTLLDAADGAYFTAQTHFAGHADVGFDARVHIAGKHGGNDGEIYGGVGDAQSACYVEEHVLLPEFEAHALLQNGKQHVEAADVEARGAVLWNTVGGSADEGLRLDEEGADAFYGRGDGHAAETFVRLGEEQFGRIVHLPEPVLQHLVDAQFGRAAEAVFYAAQDAVHVVLVAFELEHGVNDMFQHFGSCQRAFLGDMAYEHDGRVALFGVFEQGRGAFAHLGDAAGRTLCGFGGNGLYGVHDEQVGLLVLQMGKNMFERGLAHHVAVVAAEQFGMFRREALRTQFQLAGTFLPAHVEHFTFRNVQYRLQKQGRFAYARFASQQHQRAVDQTSSQHAVEFGIVHVDTWLLRCVYIGEWNGP